jgi:hypothetical protein
VFLFPEADINTSLAETGVQAQHSAAWNALFSDFIISITTLSQNIPCTRFTAVKIYSTLKIEEVSSS